MLVIITPKLRLIKKNKYKGNSNCISEGKNLIVTVSKLEAPKDNKIKVTKKSRSNLINFLIYPFIFSKKSLAILKVGIIVFFT